MESEAGNVVIIAEQLRKRSEGVMEKDSRLKYCITSISSEDTRLLDVVAAVEDFTPLHDTSITFSALGLGIDVRDDRYRALERGLRSLRSKRLCIVGLPLGLFESWEGRQERVKKDARE